ncbi:Sec-independent protein translocase subunit TatA/TatB [Acinetobacter sp. ANC 5383]
MLNIGLFEFIFFISFALIFLGPEKLLELLKSMYQLYQKIKCLVQNFQTDIERELKLNQLQQTLEFEINKVKDLEKILSHKIHAEIDSDLPIYIGFPYSNIGKIEAIIPIERINHIYLYPFSYSILNKNIINSIPSFIRHPYL